jgi:anaerobic magnesium-protoporphyrin IX monomethyl ester cyclase
MEKAYILAKKAGIRPCPNFMIGSPGESIETVNETIDFIKRLKMENVTLSITTPFPGSKLFDDVKEKTGNLRWDDFYFVNPALANEERVPVSCCGLSGGEVMELFNYASRKIFMRKEYIINRLLKVYSFKEFASIIRQGWQLFKSLFRNKK